MATAFFEAFPTVKLNGELQDLMQQAEVERVTATKRQDRICIYLSSAQLITYRQRTRLESEIRSQLFAKQPVQVQVRETFHLSAQYTPKNLLDAYMESILEEIREIAPVEYTTLQDCKFSFPTEEEVRIEVRDLPISRSLESDILEHMTRILTTRCGLKVHLALDFVAPPEEEEEEKPVYQPVFVADDSYDLEEKDDTSETEGQPGGAADKSAEGKPAESKPAESKPQKPAEEKKPAGGGRNSQGFSGGGRFRRGTSGQRGRGFEPMKRSEDPDVIYGRGVEDDATPISDIYGESQEVTIRGQILSFEALELRKIEKTILTFPVSDGTDSIVCKIFARNEDVAELTSGLKPGSFIKVHGMTMFDKFVHELTVGSITGIKKIPDFHTKRMDTAETKRVELHCHTKMSDMDGVSDVKSIVKQAYKWGMPAIAITDHGVVQALTEANHVWEDLYKDEAKKRKEAGETLDRQNFFKVIQGVECYLVDDLRPIVVNSKDQSLKDSTYVVFDIETTGFSPVRNRIIEIGAVKVQNGKIIERFSEFINPEVPIPYRITQLTSITDEMVMKAETAKTILPKFVEFCKDAVLVGHNVSFDISFINQYCLELDIPADFTTVDTLGLSRAFFPLQAKHTLDAVAKTLNIVLGHHHRAVDDAECTAEIFLKFQPMLEEKQMENLTDVNALSVMSPDSIKRLRPHHCILLAKNTLGRVHLYTLVSKSHLQYFQRFPLIPKSELMKYREGIIVGSACCAGELYGAVIEDRPAAEIARLVNFYDYLEIQPVANNHFMVESDKYDSINSDDDIREVNARIVKLGEQFHKPVVATCDVHFLNPEDQIYRTILQAGMGFDEETPAPLYLRTTEEMLEEFGYLGADKAEEICIANPRKIMNMCDSISPVRPDKCPPIIPDSDQILTKICYDRAHEIYGEDLPEIVHHRLQHELDSIIKNGFAVMYIIAQKLVWKSVEDGYLVGSRGSVGSSFVAFTSGITEVNSLAPHYICPHCHYSDFDSEEVKAYGGKSGCDMPDKDCPKCGTRMIKDGFDIPFETFLGFKGDKEPDIDLNFSGEYQSKAHKYTEVIFGYGQTFRAGTIAGLADKTAYGYVAKYYEAQGENKRRCEIDRILQGLVGVRRGTGQHPGGIIVLPVGEDINSFTPVQHPANDMTTATITTHYDYHSIDHNLLKLDILGHDDPTMIRFLQDATDVDPTTVPLDDQKVMSLWMNTDALGITPDQIGGTKLGCLGIPEFGTDFAMQMVIDASPSTFSHLIRISGLSHGTDVWLGNAQTLIQEGKATIDTAICCRDDIMIYLIQKGLEPGEAFSIMENVRKGKVAKGGCKDWPKWSQDMRDHDVPDWYIWSCEKIKYMFPKAHAAAYVMMAWRIAWFKVYRPQAFYAAWFSIRAKAFSYEAMCQGEAHLHGVMQEMNSRKDSWSAVEKDLYAAMRLVEEMYERGINFVPIDLFRVKSRLFQVDGDSVMPSLTAIDGMGEKAADAVVEAAKDGPFLSRDDFRQRTKCPQAVVDKMAELGILGDIPESNQISLFDLF